MLATANRSLVNILVADIFAVATGVVDTVKIFLLSTSLCKILYIVQNINIGALLSTKN